MCCILLYQHLFVIRNKKRYYAPMFSIDIWNVHERTLQDLPRTSNPIESFHSALNSSVTATHPSVWKLLNAFKKVESLASFKVSQFQVGAKPKQKKVYRYVSKRLKECCMNYDPEHKLKFLRNIAHNLTLHK